MVYKAHGWVGFHVLGTRSYAPITPKFMSSCNHREIVGIMLRNIVDVGPSLFTLL